MTADEVEAARLALIDDVRLSLVDFMEFWGDPEEVWAQDALEFLTFLERRGLMVVRS